MKMSEFSKPWEIIGDKIYAARVGRGWTQAELAEHWRDAIIDLGRKAPIGGAALISQRENGKTASTLAELAAFERALSLDSGTLAGLLIDGDDATAEVIVHWQALDPAHRAQGLMMLRGLHELQDGAELPTMMLAAAFA